MPLSAAPGRGILCSGEARHQQIVTRFSMAFGVFLYPRRAPKPGWGRCHSRLRALERLILPHHIAGKDDAVVRLEEAPLFSKFQKTVNGVRDRLGVVLGLRSNELSESHNDLGGEPDPFFGPPARAWARSAMLTAGPFWTAHG
jgi:hypothetical protein